MSLLHAIVSRGPVILAEHSASPDPNTGSLLETILQRIPPSASKLTYAAEERLIHYIRNNDDVTFLCLADDAFGRKTPFAFLAEVQREFLSNYSADQIASAPPYGMNAFAERLSKLMNKFETSQDAVRDAQQEVQNVKDIMVKNVEQILSRGERMDLLVDKTDNLSTQARAFRKRSAALRRSQWWKNQKLMAVSGLSIVLILYLFIASACGMGLNHCSR